MNMAPCETSVGVCLILRPPMTLCTVLVGFDAFWPAFVMQCHGDREDPRPGIKVSAEDREMAGAPEVDVSRSLLRVVAPINEGVEFLSHRDIRLVESKRHNHMIGNGMRRLDLQRLRS